jgi:hypothetical protein
MGSSGAHVSLSVVSGVIAAPVTLNQNVITTVISTPVLAVGTYIAQFSAPVLTTTTNQSFDARAVMTSGTSTISGQSSSSAGYTSAIGSGVIVPIELSCEIVITSPGVIAFEVEMSGSATAATVLSSTHINSYAGACGYTLVKVN